MPHQDIQKIVSDLQNYKILRFNSSFDTTKTRLYDNLKNSNNDSTPVPLHTNTNAKNKYSKLRTIIPDN